MKQHLLNAAIAALLAAAATSALAQGAPLAPPVPPEHMPPPPGAGFAPPHGPRFAVVNDLEQLHRLYAMTGHDGEMIAVYHDVLNRTQDPMLRHFVYDALAREELKPAHPDQAIATLRTSLGEDIAEVNRAPQATPSGTPGTVPTPQ